MLKPNTSSFRILSGQYKGTKLAFPDDRHTHPMGSREKLALFNIISTNGMRVLDLYAGSGALGLEALSRGAKSIVFVEKSPKIAQIIISNLNKLGLSVAQKPLKLSAFSVSSSPEAASALQVAKCAPTAVWAETTQKIAKTAGFKGQFDLILADPPYDAFSTSNSLLDELQSLEPLLAPGGRLVLSSPAHSEPLSLPGLAVLSTHTYAAARLTVYARPTP